MAGGFVLSLATTTATQHYFCGVTQTINLLAIERVYKYIKIGRFKSLFFISWSLSIFWTTLHAFEIEETPWGSVNFQAIMEISMKARFQRFPSRIGGELAISAQMYFLMLCCGFVYSSVCHRSHMYFCYCYHLKTIKQEQKKASRKQQVRAALMCFPFAVGHPQGLWGCSCQAGPRQWSSDCSGWRHKELHLLRALQEGTSQSLHRVLHCWAEHGNCSLGLIERSVWPFSVSPLRVRV